MVSAQADVAAGHLTAGAGDTDDTRTERDEQIDERAADAARTDDRDGQVGEAALGDRRAGTAASGELGQSVERCEDE